MSDYGKLVEALRHCTVDAGGFADCRGCPEEGHSFDCETKMHMEAAAAIEALQAEVKRLELDNEDYEHENRRLNGENEALRKNATEYMKVEAEWNEPKRGEWIDGDGRRVTARCSVCGHLRLGNGAEYANKSVHFCENCGSKMGGQNDEP